jgi:hypothetical protein
VIDDWQLDEPSTRDAAIIIRKLRLDGTVLVVLTRDELDMERSFANLPRVQTTTFDQLSAHDVLRADWLLFSDRTVPKAGGRSDARGDEASTDETVEATDATTAETAETETAETDAATETAETHDPTESADASAAAAESADASDAATESAASDTAAETAETDTAETDSTSEEGDADA